MIALSLITGPTLEPVSLAEAKEHMRYEENDADTQIGHMIVAARKLCEQITNRQLINATWEWKFDAFPSDSREIWLKKPPLSSVTTFSYLDQNGNSQTLTEGTHFDVDTYNEPGRIVLDADESNWPNTEAARANAVTIRYVAGYGAAAENVPEPLRMWIMSTVGDLFDHRESKFRNMYHPNPNPTLEWLIGPYKVEFI